MEIPREGHQNQEHCQDYFSYIPSHFMITFKIGLICLPAIFVPLACEDTLASDFFKRPAQSPNSCKKDR